MRQKKGQGEKGGFEEPREPARNFEAGTVGGESFKRKIKARAWGGEKKNLVKRGHRRKLPVSGRVRVRKNIDLQSRIFRALVPSKNRGVGRKKWNFGDLQPRRGGARKGRTILCYYLREDEALEKLEICPHRGSGQKGSETAW